MWLIGLSTMCIFWCCVLRIYGIWYIFWWHLLWLRFYFISAMNTILLLSCHGGCFCLDFFLLCRLIFDLCIQQGMRAWCQTANWSMSSLSASFCSRKLYPNIFNWPFYVDVVCASSINHLCEVSEINRKCVGIRYANLIVEICVLCVVACICGIWIRWAGWESGKLLRFLDWTMFSFSFCLFLSLRRNEICLFGLFFGRLQS